MGLLFNHGVVLQFGRDQCDVRRIAAEEVRKVSHCRWCVVLSEDHQDRGGGFAQAVAGQNGLRRPIDSIIDLPPLAQQNDDRLLGGHPPIIS